MDSVSSKRVSFHGPRNIFTLFADGSVARHPVIPCIPASPLFTNGVATRDLHIDRHIGLWVRLFLPQTSLHTPPKLLPVVFYAHGGAYCIGDPAWYPFHGFCHRMALKSHAIWISVAYRLAPEHRLPAAYDDGFAAFRWLQSQASLQAKGAADDPWLQEFADFSRCFIAGESAGGTIALNVAMRAAGKDWAPINVRGLLLVHPGFHTEAKRHSMIDSIDGDEVHRLYDLALPEGENLDYPPINPLNPEAPSLSPLSVYRNVLVAAAEKDFRYEMTLKFYETLKPFCENVQLVISKDQDHAFHVLDPECEEAVQLEKKLVDFLCAC